MPNLFEHCRGEVSSAKPKIRISEGKTKLVFVLPSGSIFDAVKDTNNFGESGGSGRNKGFTTYPCLFRIGNKIVTGLCPSTAYHMFRFDNYRVPFSASNNFVPQSLIWKIIGKIDCPNSVSSYSTLGGTIGKTSRFTIPPFSKSRAVCVNILFDTPCILRCKSEDRNAPSFSI